MKTIILHGHLKTLFGESFSANVDSVADAVRLMACNFPEFLQALKDRWFVIRTERNPKGVQETCLEMLTGDKEIHFHPVIAGRIKGLFGLFFGLPLLGNIGLGAGALGLGGAGAAGVGGFLGFGGAAGGFGSILLGITVIGIGYLITNSLASKKNQERENPDEKASFIFDGAVNNTEQGGPVPLVYGRVRTGSVVISGGLTIEEVT